MTPDTNEGTRQNADGRSVLRWRDLLRAFAPVVAVLLLVSQVAAASCMAMPSGPAPAGLAAFPICHAGVDVDGHGQPNAPGGHSEPCPYCALHCGALALLPPTIALAQRPVAITLPAQRPILALPSVLRYPAGASPRGPPRMI